jgi:hypothetical protein
MTCDLILTADAERGPLFACICLVTRETAAAAHGIFGRGFQTLMNAASVCRSFETSRRREALTFTHHLEVAALPPKEADMLLDKAEAESLPPQMLRDLVESCINGHLPQDQLAHLQRIEAAERDTLRAFTATYAGRAAQ